jgi:dTMP kinase
MFVVFEGIDGSGKTTLSNCVSQALSERGIRVNHVRAGGKFGSPIVEALRALTRDSKNLGLLPEVEFLLLRRPRGAADRRSIAACSG